MAHQYARRTQEEAKELARQAFLISVSERLSPAEMEEIRLHGLLTGGSVGPSWEQVVGFVPNDRLYYEFEIYKPADLKPYIEKSYVRMLSPRDRSSEEVHFMWRPAIERA